MYIRIKLAILNSFNIHVVVIAMLARALSDLVDDRLYSKRFLSSVSASLPTCCSAA